MKGALYYGTKYGATRKISQRIALFAGDVTLYRIDRMLSVENDVDFYIVGTPIYNGKPVSGVSEFIEENRHALCQKPLFLFITSWAQSTVYQNQCERFLSLLRAMLAPCVPALERSLPGRLVWDEIEARDQNVMGRIVRRIRQMSPTFDDGAASFRDVIDWDLCASFGKEIRDWIADQGHLV